MDLRHIRYFVTVAEAGSVGRAAAALGLAQPALSRQIKDLEHEIGSPLLKRTPKGVITTAAGDAFLAGATRILGAAMDAVDATRRAALGQAGVCNLAVGRITMSTEPIAHAISRLLEALPGVAIDIHEVWAMDQHPRLAAGTLDIGLSAPPADPALASEPFEFIDYGSAIFAVNHRLAGREMLEPEELENEPLAGISPARDPMFTDLAQRALAKARINSPQEFVYASPLSIAMVVAAGRGWSIAPTLMRERPLEGTRVVPVRGLELPYRVDIVWRKDESRAVVLQVLEALRDIRDGRPVRIPRVAVQPLPEAHYLPPGLELRHLRYFATVADEGSFGRAAERLGVTQPSLSRTVADLERLLEAGLLTRTARGTALTDAGTALRGKTRALLETLEGTLADMRPARRGMASRCLIGTVQTIISSRLLVTLTRLVGERWPKLTMLFDEVATPEQPQALRDGLIDVGVCHSFPGIGDEPELAHERLVEDAIECALLPAGHPLAGRERLDASDLASLPLLFMPRAFHAGLYDGIMGALKGLGLTPRVDAGYDKLHVVWALAAEHKGWTLGFRSHRERAPGGLVAVPIAGLHFPWGLDMLWRTNDPSTAVARVLEALREARGLLAAPGRATMSDVQPAARHRTPTRVRNSSPGVGPRSA